jgi:hypothetical protein
MSLRRFLPFVFILSLLIAAMSCKDDWLQKEYDSTILWEGGIKGPVIFGNLSIKDLLKEFDSTGYVSEDSTGLLYGAYSKDTVLRAPDVLEIPDQEFVQFFFRVDTNIPGWALGSIGEIYTDSLIKGFEFVRMGDERLDSIQIKAGNMRIFVRSTIKHAGTLTLSSDRIFVNGQRFEEVILISDTTGNFEQTINRPMAGGTLVLDNSVPDSTSLHLNARFDLINSGNDILTSEEVQIINSFQNLEFRGAYGYIGLFDSLLIDKAELEFDLFPEGFEGLIKLANPQISIRTENSMGVPFDVGLLDLEAHFRDGSGIPINIFDPDVNPLRINAPVSSDEHPVKDSTFIDNTNSDIYLAARSDLVSLQYSVRAEANPDGPRSNFIMDDSELAINVEGRIPMDLRIEDFVLSDTFNFDLTEDEDADFTSENIDNLKMQMKTDNGMPLDLGLQLYFVDSAQNWLTLDSLFAGPTNILESGKVDVSGDVTESTPKDITIELTRSQIDNLMDADKLLMKAYAETAEGGTRDVKFYADYALYFKLGAQVEINYTIEPEEE